MKVGLDQPYPALRIDTDIETDVAQAIISVQLMDGTQGEAVDAVNQLIRIQPADIRTAQGGAEGSTRARPSLKLVMI